MRIGVCLVSVALLVSGCEDRSAKKPPAQEKPSVPAAEKNEPAKVSADDVRQKLIDAAKGVKALAAQEIRERLKKAQPEVDRVKRQINDLRARAETAIKSPENRKRVEQGIEELRRKADEAGVRLDELSKSSGEAAAKLDTKVRDLLRELDESYRRTSDEIQKGATSDDRPSKP